MQPTPAPPSPPFLPPVAPQFLRAPSLATRPLDSAATVAIVALALVAGLDAIGAVASIWDLNSLEGYNQPGERATRGDAVFGLLAFLGLLATLFAAVAFIVWFWRAYKNVEALGAPGMRLGPGWAIGAWFVPIINLWFPKQIANDAWRASAPGRPPHAWAEWTKEPVPNWVTWWWVLWIFSGALGFLGGLGASTALTDSAYRTAAALGAFSSALAAAAALLAIYLVRQLTSRQRRACELAEASMRAGYAAR